MKITITYYENPGTMLIDSNAYIGHWPFRRYEYDSLEALSGRMTEFGVDKSVVSNLNGIFYKNTQHANEELYGAIRSRQEYQNKFIPFAVINPIYGGWRRDFEQCTGNMGMKGVRLYPKYHSYDITHPNCIDLVKMCRDKDLPVAFSLRMVDSRTSSWMDIEKEWSLKDVMPVVREVPDAKYIICNVANNTGLSDEDLALFRSASIKMDTSGRALSNWKDLLERFGVSSFCFGTHAPILDYCTGLLRIESLRTNEANEEEKIMMRSGNISKLLNL